MAQIGGEREMSAGYGHDHSLSAPEWVPFEFLVLADNIFLVSSSIIDIVKRTQEIADVFGRRGLRFNQSSLEILPSKEADKEATRVPLNEGMEFSCADFGGARLLSGWIGLHGDAS